MAWEWVRLPEWDVAPGIISVADLQVKQQEEMKKLREETAAKMQSLRDAHKKAMENLLTDEQKKFIESKQVKPAAAPAPVTTPAK